MMYFVIDEWLSCTCVGSVSRNIVRGYQGLLILPQKPYLTDGTLRNQVCNLCAILCLRNSCITFCIIHDCLNALESSISY